MFQCGWKVEVAQNHCGVASFQHGHCAHSCWGKDGRNSKDTKFLLGGLFSECFCIFSILIVPKKIKKINSMGPRVKCVCSSKNKAQSCDHTIPSLCFQRALHAVGNHKTVVQAFLITITTLQNIS